ncbi:MAG: tRNA (N(6)-L-threonylcarbamoyladenosine(37)-C(2))-methylthiotransferase MtaB [Nitrospirota bacterium]
MKVSLLTLGCKVNQAEAAQWEGALRSRGHAIVGLGDAPDVCVVNTCTVTGKSDYQSRQLIRRAGRTGARVLVTGCYEELNDERARGLGGVEHVVRNAEKDSIISYIDEQAHETHHLLGAARTRAFLKVQDGCDRRCSYCLVWRARGRPRSVEPEAVARMVRRAVAEGAQEVVLTGIHLGLYGVDLTPAKPLSALVRKVLSDTAVKRVRLSSLEVGEVDQSLLELFEDERLLRHLHIPLQSGHDGVLRRMNRHYSAEAFRRRVQGISERYPGMALGTDVIAGFPGETDQAFLNTYNLLESLPFTYVHVFPYSPRPGTPAVGMPGAVSGPLKKKRAARLRSLALEKKKAFMKRQVGRILEVLVEEELPDGLVQGTSRNYLKVRLPGEGRLKGSLVPVRIGALEDEALWGEPVAAP